MSVFHSLLNNTMSLYRRIRTADGQGGWEISYTANGAVLGRIRPASSSEQVIAQQEGRWITHVLYVEAGSDIARGDLVVVGDLAVDVEGVREPSRAGEHLEIDCLERQLETVVFVDGS